PGHHAPKKTESTKGASLLDRHYTRCTSQPAFTDRVEHRLDTVERRLDFIAEEIGDHRQKIKRLEHKVGIVQ
ncbi:MAG: hypothetical protein SGI88_21275, partial [Candidatus Hydrogenedentes bacterium]|nr:hypothetical protein [Candidatus Hydrogenedentota bacterium]